MGTCERAAVESRDVDTLIRSRPFSVTPDKRGRIDMSEVTSILGDDNRKITGDVLQQALVDLIDLSLLAKQAHWNVYGRFFTPLHRQLDETVHTAREASDLLAERAMAIGVAPDGRAETVHRKTRLPSLPQGALE